MIFYHCLSHSTSLRKLGVERNAGKAFKTACGLKAINNDLFEPHWLENISRALLLMRFSAHTIVSYSDKIVRPYSEYARSDRKSVNRFLPVLDLLSGRNSLMLTKKNVASGDENDKLVGCKS